MLIVFAGLPGTGKSSIARELARELGAVWLRVDSIEQGMRDSGVVRESIDDAGYRAGYAVAVDNLRLGRTVVADSVNGWMLTRNAWREAGLQAGAPVVEIETICSDLDEHRRRIEERSNEVLRTLKGKARRGVGAGLPHANTRWGSNAALTQALE
jgi:predicted kinase